MYNRFLDALENAKEDHKGSIRGRDIEALQLLGDYDTFVELREKPNEKMMLLNELLKKIETIDTELHGNHRLLYFRSILKTLDFTSIDMENNEEIERVNFLLALVKQIMNFEYMN